MRLIDSKRFSPEGIFNEMREKHKQKMIRDKFLAPLYIRKELERKYPDVDVIQYISELEKELGINNTYKYN